ncbi:potassium channel family protein [Agromyces salentinus]|uniref:Potassium channel family protein n=1 Tax=Agromyces salentinus TaxID=269421 RepID=A0ABN2MYC4_9MICO|nr:potassium channel family protein [Agromyces salentinus]
MSVRPPIPAPRRIAWERRTALPLVVLGVAFIVAYSVYVLTPSIPRGPDTVLFWTLILAWLVFVVDVTARIALTPHGGRWAFIRSHPIDVLSAIVPVFRAFRVLTLLHAVPYLRRRSGAAVRANIVIYAASYAIVFVYFIALATLQAERDAPGATITTFGDSVWWAIVTIATVGYGDMYPITTEGRFYAVFLMGGGVVIVGTASATIISYMNERVAQVREHRRHAESPTAPGSVGVGGFIADAADDDLEDDEGDGEDGVDRGDPVR